MRIEKIITLYILLYAYIYLCEVYQTLKLLNSYYEFYVHIQSQTHKRFGKTHYYVLYIYIRIYLDKTLKHMSRNKKISLKHINIYINRIEILGRI